jgi:hypothetical protein
VPEASAGVMVCLLALKAMAADAAATTCGLWPVGCWIEEMSLDVGCWIERRSECVGD